MKGVRQVGASDWSSQPTNPDWSEDQTTAKWTPKHVHAVHWPKPKRRAPATPQGGVGEISQVVVAPAKRAAAQPSEEQVAALQAKTRLIWMYSGTAAVAVFLALMSSHALLGLFGQASLPHASAASLPPTPRATTKKPAAPQVLVASPQLMAAAPRHRAGRTHARTRVPSRAQAESAAADGAMDADVEPDMNLMDAPITAREARAIAEGRARAAGNHAAVLEDARPGTLRINSRPWAQLYVDGHLVGNTPQLGLRVSPGEHSIRLVNPQFAMSKVFSVYVGAGESITRVESLDE